MLSSNREMQANNELQQYAQAIRGAEFAQEFNLLMETLKEFRASLPNQEHVAFEALNKIADKSGHLAQLIYQETPGAYNSYTSATPIEKVLALKDTLIHAKQVAQNPFNPETTQALLQSTKKMENTIAGSEATLKLVAGVVAMALLLSVLILMPLVALHVVSQPNIALRLGACLLALKGIWIAESVSPMADCASEMRSQSYALNRNCHFNQNNRQVPAPQAQPEQPRLQAIGLVA